jgi:hypothetical protein
MKSNPSLIILLTILAGCGGGTSGTGAGDPTQQPVFVTINGQANKGPYSEGANITAQRVASTGSLGATSTASTAESGGFSLSVEENTINLITVDGSYFSETTGTFTEDTIAISGVFAGAPDDSANVNVLTHLIHDRVLQLMADGMTASAAITSAEDELTLALSTILPGPTTETRFNDLVVINALQDEPNSEGNGYLLALSSILEQHAFLRADANSSNSSTELMTVLDALADDLATDGELDLTGLESDLIEAQQTLNPDNIHQNLFDFDDQFKEQVVSAAETTQNSNDLECAVQQANLRCFSAQLDDATPGADREAILDVSLTSVVADMNAYIDTDGDGLVNSEDSDDDGDGIEDDVDSRPFEALLLVPTESAARFAAYMKAGLRQWSGVENNTQVRLAANSPFVLEDGIDVPSAEAVDSQEVVLNSFVASADRDDGFTTTNVLVAGVDEIDLVKYDGEFLYVANGTDIQSLRTHQDGSAADVLGHVAMASEDGPNYIQGMYLTEDRAMLAAVSGGLDFSWFVDWFAPWNSTGTTRIDLLDINDPAAMTVQERLDIEGNYVNSRRIGDVLYIITRFTPDIADELIRPAETDEEKQANEDLIEQLDTNDLLPTVTYLDGSTTPLVDSDNCFLPPTTEAEEGIEYPTLTTITAVNLSNPRDLTSVCLTDGIQGMHMSLDAIYLAALDAGRFGFGFYNNTVIHKFSIDTERPAYVGSGTVRGTFWGDPTFLMGEHDGNLTVVTTRNVKDERRFEHILSVLGESETPLQLTTLGQIPNKNSADVIGKPGEQIFASRILGDRAYIVTFEQVDPVYVIDLADPSDPQILGELEIPGFSTYLHPISDDLLLGVGRNTTTVDGIPFFSGINLRLFDVSVPSELSVLSEISIGRRGTETPISWDPHAFTILFDGTNHRLTVPVRVHGAHVEEDQQQSPWRYYPWTHEALYMFEVNTAENQLEQTGILVANDFDTGYRFAPNCCSWTERVFLNGEVVHYLRNNRVYSAFWNSPEDSAVAFIPTVFPLQEPVACTEELRNGLSIGVQDRVSGDWLGCASVIAREGDFESVLQEDCTSEDERAEIQPNQGGLYERPGRYEITVTSEGYETWTGSDVVVQADQCHVHPTHLGVFLKPMPEE